MSYTNNSIERFFDLASKLKFSLGAYSVVSKGWFRRLRRRCFVVRYYRKRVRGCLRLLKVLLRRRKETLGDRKLTQVADRREGSLKWCWKETNQFVAVSVKVWNSLFGNSLESEKVMPRDVR